MTPALQAAYKRLHTLRKKLAEQPVPQTLKAAKIKIKLMQQIMDQREKIKQLKRGV